MATKVELVSRSPRAVTVRLPDGSERTIPGRHVLLVYCTKADLDAQIERRPRRQTEVDATLDGSTLVLFGTANWV